ncbi:MAG: TolC family protein [Bacteroidales bacterium]
MKQLYKIFFISAILLIVASNIAQAEDKITLTLEKCREMALESNNNLKRASAQISKSEDMLAAYRSNRLPNFSIDGTFIYSDLSHNLTIEGGYLPTYIADATTGELTPNIAGLSPDGSYIFNQYAYMPDQLFTIDVGAVFNAGIKVEQPIYMGGKISNSIKLAQIGVEVAQISQRRTESEMILAADNAFYSYLKVEDMLLSAEKYCDVIIQFQKQVESLLRNGMCTRNDLLKVQVRLNEANLMKRKAENGLRLARMNLCYVIGLPMTTEQLNVVDDFDMDIIVDQYNLDITARPEYELLNKQVEAKELEVRIARSDFLPSVAAMASYGYYNGTSINDETLLEGSSFTGGVTVSIPLFHWGEGRRKVSASKHDVNMAKYELADLSEKMTLELLQAINSYDEAVLEVQMCSNSLTQAEENMRQSGNLYNNGTETLADYLEAQALWQKAMSDLTEAKATQRIAYTQYCKTSGTILAK